MLWLLFFIILVVGGIGNLVVAVGSRCDDWLNNRNK